MAIVLFSSFHVAAISFSAIMGMMIRQAIGQSRNQESIVVPSGKHTKSYWKLPFTVDFPLKLVIFHSYGLPEVNLGHISTGTLSCNGLPTPTLISSAMCLLNMREFIAIYSWLVVWNIFLFFHILGIITPTDFHIVQSGRSTTNQIVM